jgi:hypothetical protein
MLVDPNDVEALRAALTSGLARDRAASPRDFVAGRFSLASTMRAYAELAGG